MLKRISFDSKYRNKFGMTIIAIAILCFLTTSTNLKADFFDDNLLFGVKGGINLASMVYSDEPYSIYEQKTFVRPLFSAFLEGNLTNSISFRPEIMYIGRGVKIDDLGVPYELAPNYLDLRFPFLFYLRTPSVQPYIILSPNFGFVTGGKAKLYGYEDTELNKGYIDDIDVLLSAGVGVKFPVDLTNYRFYIGLEGQYNFISADNEPDNFRYGTRSNRGIELALTLSFPLGGGNKSSSTSSTSTTSTSTATTKTDPCDDPRTPKEIRDCEGKTIYFEGDSYVVTSKKCYEVKEYRAYRYHNYNMTKKRICFYDVNFEPSSTKLDKKSRENLDQIVKLLKDVPKMDLKIHGHTDSTGTEETNIRLSKERAEAVRDYLISQGVKNKVEAEWHWWKEPIEPHTGKRQDINRRVEFEIIRY